MRSYLCVKYWSLLCCITLFSSSLICYVLAIENLAAAQAAAAAADFRTAAAADTQAAMQTADSANLHSAVPPEQVLPNYKKIKKLDDPDGGGGQLQEEAIASDATHAPLCDETPGSINERDFLAINSESFAADTMPITATNAEAISQSSKTTNAVDKDDETGAAAQSQTEQPTNAADTHERAEAEQLSATLSRDQEKEEEAKESLNQFENNNKDASKNVLPDITEIPTVTSAVNELSDLPLEVFEATRNGIDAIVLDSTLDSSAQQQRMNNTLELVISTGNTDEMKKDDQIVKINDSGGDEMPHITTASPNAVPSDIHSQNAENIPIESMPSGGVNTMTPELTTNASKQHEQQQAAEVPTIATPLPNVPPIVEEVPIPVFSEWAQKQMEAAEKQQQLEQDVVNTSTQRKNNNNNTNGGSKLPPLKLRSKNYASPDCGAKIISSNPDASHTGAVLSASKDEYMLSPCTNRIWFVVELCEAIQAQKIDLANFELFSSSPRNFTVAVSNRFPTRDWSNVGRFIAEDARTVQSFDLHPHLFGKFVRVDIHSHYSKEHFCPVSLFRVFGTSEFEAFETENHPNDDLDDFDDDFGLEQANVKNTENNLFKSASDAVLSIVKKAAEVLVKPASSSNATAAVAQPINYCRTPAFSHFSCAECSSAFVERVNDVLSCQPHKLSDLLSIRGVRRDLLNTQTCAKVFGIEMKPVLSEEACSGVAAKASLAMHKSYYLDLLPTDYLGALCQLVAEHPHNSKLPPHMRQKQTTNAHGDDGELSLNLTIDKKLTQGGTDFERVEVKTPPKKLLNTEEGDAKFNAQQQSEEQSTMHIHNEKTATTAFNPSPDMQLVRPEETELPTTTSPMPGTTTNAPEKISDSDSSSDNSEEDAVTPDVNIFNVNIADDSTEASSTTTTPTTADPDPQVVNILQQPVYEGSADYSHTTITSTTESPSSTGSSSEDPSSWDSIDNLLTSTTVTPGVVVTVGSSVISQPAAVNGMNMQQKIPNGGPHSESIFIRLSNRIKALERNMSLSGQYLEELSRRYKKQVEDLQQTLTLQTLNVRALEEQNRQQGEYEQLLSERNLQLKDELEDLTLQVHACIVVIIFVGAFVFLVVLVGILFIRSMRRETRELVALQSGGAKRKTPSQSSTTAANQRKLHRRKSYEDFSDHQQTLNKSGGGSGEKHRRPSEEAMLILKECGGDANGMGQDVEITELIDPNQDIKSRRRKISVCYSNNNNITNCNMNEGDIGGGGGNVQKSAVPNNKRKNEKHSWPNSEQSQQQARKHLEQLHSMEEYDGFTEADVLGRSVTPLGKYKVNHLPNGNNSFESVGRNGLKGKPPKKRAQVIKRQISAPNSTGSSRDFAASQSDQKRFPDTHIIGSNSDYDESLMLDEDDLDNFLPVSDLAYNEFMPEGPSGYQILSATQTEEAATANGNHKLDNKAASSKKSSRRLSSPAFFKSPFSKSLKMKPASGAATATAQPHESTTSWEWYRSKKSAADKQLAAAKQQQLGAMPAAVGVDALLRPSNSDNFYQRSSPIASIDSSSLSEINFPTNSNENSFRILEEAILSSASAATTVSNGNSNGAGGCGSSSGGSSSSSNNNNKQEDGEIH